MSVLFFAVFVLCLAGVMGLALSIPKENFKPITWVFIALASAGPAVALFAANMK